MTTPSGPDWTGVNEDNIEELLVEAAKSTVSSISIFVQSEGEGTFLSASWRDEEGELQGVRERSGDPRFKYGISVLPGYHITIERLNEREISAGSLVRNQYLLFEEEWRIVDNVAVILGKSVRVRLVGLADELLINSDMKVRVRG